MPITLNSRLRNLADFSRSAVCLCVNVFLSLKMHDSTTPRKVIFVFELQMGKARMKLIFVLF